MHNNCDYMYFNLVQSNCGIRCQQPNFHILLIISYYAVIPSFSNFASDYMQLLRIILQEKKNKKRQFVIKDVRKELKPDWGTINKVRNTNAAYRAKIKIVCTRARWPNNKISGFPTINYGRLNGKDYLSITHKIKKIIEESDRLY